MLPRQNLTLQPVQARKLTSWREDFSNHLAIKEEEIEFHVSKGKGEFEGVGGFAKKMHKLQTSALEFGDKAGVVVVYEYSKINVPRVSDHVALPIPTQQRP